MERRRALEALISVDKDKVNELTRTRKTELLARIRSRQSHIKSSFYSRAEEDLKAAMQEGCEPLPLPQEHGAHPLTSQSSKASRLRRLRLDGLRQAD